MVLGQTSATAAIHAIREKQTVQNIDYEKLRSQLTQDKQVLRWSQGASKSPLSTDPKTFAGIVLDDNQSDRNGFDSISQSNGPFLASHYRHDSNAGKGIQDATFSFKIKKAGRYKLQIAWTPHANRATNVPITLTTSAGQQTFQLDQQQKPDESPFGTLGVFDLAPGVVTVGIRNANTDGYVILDGARLVETSETRTSQ